MAITQQSSYIETTDIDGLLVINRPMFNDDRGFFREIGRIHDITNVLGKPFIPIQINHSRSYPNVIRGLHAENWNKLVYPVTGVMFAALVDIRPQSRTFKKIVTLTINDANRHSLFIPKGVANSICALENERNEPVDYVYFVDTYYDGSDTTAIAWNDPTLAIKWPIDNPILARRDKINPTFKELFPTTE